MEHKELNKEEFEELNKEEFENLCELQMPASSIKSLFAVSKQDLENWCKKTYSKSFAEAYYCFAYNGKVKLIETMIEVAKTDHGMEKYLIRSAQKSGITQNILIQSAESGNCEAIKIINSLKGKKNR